MRKAKSKNKGTTLFRNIGELATFRGFKNRDGRNVREEDLEISNKMALIAEQGTLIWIGKEADLAKDLSVSAEVDLDQAFVMPSFVECHTHTVFAGTRAAELELRNRGISYQEIAAKGGGILSTVKATRDTSKEDLLCLAQERVREFQRQGVDVLEVKSGYGLDWETELKILEVIRDLSGPKVVSTFLGAHAVPPEFKSSPEYIDFLVQVVLPKIAHAGLTDRVDIFVEKNYFSPEDGRQLLQAAQKLQLTTTVHADQLSLSGGTDLALEIGAQSADHVIQIGQGQIAQLGRSDCVPVLLPAADLYLKCAYPPARKLIEAGACVALATDFNPGTSPTQDLSLVGLLARLEMRMTLPEVLCAYTYGAAKSLGLSDKYGFLDVNSSASFLIINGDWQSLFYSVGKMPLRSFYSQGMRVDLDLNAPSQVRL